MPRRGPSRSRRLSLREPGESDSPPKSTGRRFFTGWPGRALIGLLGFGIGILSSYVIDFVKLAIPVADIADIGSDYVDTTVILERDLGVQGELWVYPFEVSKHPEVETTVTQPASDFFKFHQSIRQSGAIDANITVAKLIVEGKRNNAVRIVGIRAVALTKTVPLSGGTVLVPGPQGEGESSQVAFDLDSNSMTGVAPKSGLDSSPYLDDYFTRVPAFSKYTVELKRGEQQVFQITARTYRHYVKWNIELDLFTDGTTRTIVANVSGTPLETTALLVPPGGSPTAPDETRYSEVYDFFASSDTDRFKRTK